MARGDHLRVQRVGFWHHAIDVGGGWVVDYSSDEGKTIEAMQVRLRPFHAFASATDNVETVSYLEGEAVPAEVTVLRAFARIGERAYSLLGNNCEHFCTWCKTGTRYSLQAFDAGLFVGALALWLFLGRRANGGEAEIQMQSASQGTQS